MQSRLILWAQRSVAALCLCLGTALAADTPSVPAPVEGDHVIRDFHFPRMRFFASSESTGVAASHAFAPASLFRRHC